MKYELSLGFALDVFVWILGANGTNGDVPWTLRSQCVGPREN